MYIEYDFALFFVVCALKVIFLIIIRHDTHTLSDGDNLMLE